MWIIDIIAIEISIATMYAAWLNGNAETSERLPAMEIWCFTNPAFAILLFGQCLGLWSMSLGLASTGLTYLFFMFTSVRGMIRHRKDLGLEINVSAILRDLVSRE